RILQNTGYSYTEFDNQLIVIAPEGKMIRTKAFNGKVTNQLGLPLQGVTVKAEKVDTQTATDSTGQFVINVPKNEKLIISHIGYKTQEVKAIENVVVVLPATSKNLNEVTVTALGISKQERKIGYSITRVDGSEVQLTRESTFINALSGKVAGLVVQSPINGPIGSSRVRIRGNTSFGNNQPLFVLDGIPINSRTREINPDDELKIYGGYDPGDGLSSINPDDIESISVLKGASAAALYGSQAQAGVILITTKKGVISPNLEVGFNSNTVVENMIPYDGLQYEYGRGDNGSLYVLADEIPNNNYATGLSWGEKINGQTFLDVDGLVKPYQTQSAKARFKSFFDVGLISTNSVSLSKANQKSSNRLALSQTSHQSAMPGSAGFNRYNASFRSTENFLKFHTDFKVDVSRTQKSGIPLLRGDERGSFSKFFTRTANTTDINWLKSKDANGNYLYTYINPYIAIEKTKNDQTENRIISSLNLKYDFSKSLHAQVTAGIDYNNIDALFAVFPNNRADNSGLLNTSSRVIESKNVLALLSYERDFDMFSFTSMLGANYRQSNSSSTMLSGTNFVDPTLLNFSNVTASAPVMSLAPRNKVQSLLGSAQIGYANYLYLELTGRNDWSSSLASIRPNVAKVSLFYPSANLSFVFTDALKINPAIFSYGKVRAAFGQTGSDQIPHLNDLTFALQPVVNGQPGAQISNISMPPASLKPERTKEFELGTELNFFQNRIGLDLSFYHKKTIDFLLTSNVSQSTGFSSIFINAGSMVNKGFEVLLLISPIKTKTFKWNVSFNGAKNNNKVLALSNELAQTGVQHYYNIKSKVGYGLGSIFGSPLRRGPNGEFVYKPIDITNDGIPDAVVHEKGQVNYDLNGQPIRDKNGVIAVNNDVYLGNANPDFTTGITNTFTYKNVSFSFLIDGQFGGQIYEEGIKWASFFGNSELTLLGRDGKYIPQGSIITGSNANPTFTENKLPFSPYQQYNSDGSLEYYADELSVFKKTFIKFRQISLGYSLPKSLLNKVLVKSVTLSIIGRNLFYIRKDIPIFDPQSSDSVANGFGYDSGGLPGSSTFGVNLNVKF
ncbi:MAG: hypothetical protein JWQ25_1591, partial [Daejeonella sp.]|nr:hypothetical protein [Daejeonella sp.]